MEKLKAARKVQGIMTDEDIQKELARLRDRNLAARLATQKVERLTRKGNLACRQRYEKQHHENLRKEQQNALAHLKVFGGMYDNSPLRHDIVALARGREAVKRAEAKQDAIYKATYAILDGMTGAAEDFIVNWADKKKLAAVLRKPINQEALKLKQTQLDQQVLQNELHDLKGMVQLEMDAVLDNFGILEQTLGPQQRMRDTYRPGVVDCARACLAGTPITPIGSPFGKGGAGTGTGTGSSRPGSSSRPSSRGLAAGRPGSALTNAGFVLLSNTAPVVLSVDGAAPEHLETLHNLHHREHHDKGGFLHQHAERISSHEKVHHRKILAGSAVIKKIGEDGFVHSTRMHFDALGLGKDGREIMGTGEHAHGYTPHTSHTQIYVQEHGSHVQGFSQSRSDEPSKHSHTNRNTNTNTSTDTDSSTHMHMHMHVHSHTAEGATAAEVPLPLPGGAKHQPPHLPGMHEAMSPYRPTPTPTHMHMPSQQQQRQRPLSGDSAVS